MGLKNSGQYPLPVLLSLYRHAPSHLATKYHFRELEENEVVAEKICSSVYKVAVEA